VSAPMEEEDNLSKSTAALQWHFLLGHLAL